jgi:tetratricopeptide (TPR) repeat protein
LTLDEAAVAAHTAIDKALALAPDAFQTLWQLGEIQLNLDLDYARAEGTFRRVLNRSPSNIWMHYNLATIALREGRARESTRLLATASALSAGYEQAGFLNSYAWLLNVVGDYAQALKTCAQGLGLTMGGPERATNLLNQALALVCLNRAAESEPLIQEAWDLNGLEKPERCAFFFARIGDSERARRALDAASDDSGADKYALAVGTLALGDIDAAFEAIKAAIADHDALMFDSLRIAGWWRELRDDPRYSQMVDLLESKETHTERYVQEHAARSRN